MSQAAWIEAQGPTYGLSHSDGVGRSADQPAPDLPLALCDREVFEAPLAAGRDTGEPLVVWDPCPACGHIDYLPLPGHGARCLICKTVWSHDRALGRLTGAAEDTLLRHRAATAHLTISQGVNAKGSAPTVSSP